MGRHLTPLRYPGGKQRLSPFIIEILKKNSLIDGHYVEPYAGGAGVACELLVNSHVEHIHLNDSSKQIYAFWKSVIDHPEELCRRISSASLTVTEWKRQREILRHHSQHEIPEVGFSTLYLNRCNRSGVLAGGVIGGLAQTGPWKIDARFPRVELINRVEALASRRESITITNLDAELYMTEALPQLPLKTFVYCDPPYYERSSRLYLDDYKKCDHERIADTIQRCLARKWIVSYDAASEIMGFYGSRKFILYDLQYNASRVYKGKEIFIFSDDLQIPCNSSMPAINRSISEFRSRESVAGRLLGLG